MMYLRECSKAVWKKRVGREPPDRLLKHDLLKLRDDLLSLSSTGNKGEVFFRIPTKWKGLALKYLSSAWLTDFLKLAKLSMAMLCIPCMPLPLRNTTLAGCQHGYTLLFITLQTDT